MKKDISKLLTIKQAAELLNVTPLTLRRWDRKGILKPIRIGTRGDRRYEGDELKKLIKQKKI